MNEIPDQLLDEPPFEAQVETPVEAPAHVASEVAPEVAGEAPAETGWRVMKIPDNAIYGPVDTETLKEWANAAKIAPEDMIDECDDNWRAAPAIEFLEMHWLVRLPSGDDYGPTTVGTMREFINEGVVTDKAMATHAVTNQSLPLTALVAAVDFERKRAARRPAAEANKSTALLAVEMAKDQHIRQLEEDLKELRREHELLTHRYRQLALQLQDGGKSAIAKPLQAKPVAVKASGNPPSVTARLLPRDNVPSS